MKQGSLNFVIGGPAGSGIESSGRTLTLSFVRGGYYVYANVEHMSQIRGGNNFLRLRVDEAPHENHIEEIDILIALDKQTIDEHIEEMTEGGVVIYDNESLNLPDDYNFGSARPFPVALKRIATEELKNPVMANIISLGVVCGLVGFDVSLLKDVLSKIFAKKGEEVIKLNEKAADIGAEAAKQEIPEDFELKLPKKDGREDLFIMGNEAVALASIKAGCKYVGAYPMTPSSSVLHTMAKWAGKYGIVVKHTEDEIAAMNSVIGAGFAGVRAMTCTSGGGFALMTEAVGLASMNEVPCVIINVMRPGPATGMPTRTEQGDLRQVIHSGQGDPLKIVLLPSDLKDLFHMTFEAFNLAEKYQLPVIVCYDKYLGEGFFTTAPFETESLKVDRGSILSQSDLDSLPEYKRYLFTEDGISPRSIPGMIGGIHRATSDEHDEYGDITEDAENRKLMVEKRMKKLDSALNYLPKPELIGEKTAEITFVTWGSSKAVCVETSEVIKEKGINSNVVCIRTSCPFSKEETLEILNKSKRLILVEQNYTGQLGGLIAEHTGILIEEKILRYDGRPLTAKYVLDRIKI
jgi:2-oxoglutarate ferredoxin oxidoreductase subunit alpha